jgi:hypothetical protein
MMLQLKGHRGVIRFGVLRLMFGVVARVGSARDRFMFFRPTFSFLLRAVEFVLDIVVSLPCTAK